MSQSVTVLFFTFKYFCRSRRAEARRSRRAGTASCRTSRASIIYPFLDGVGLTNGSLRSRNAAGDAAVALAHAPQLAADLLSLGETAEETGETLTGCDNNTSTDVRSSSGRPHSRSTSLSAPVQQRLFHMGGREVLVFIVNICHDRTVSIIIGL